MFYSTKQLRNNQSIFQFYYTSSRNICQYVAPKIIEGDESGRNSQFNKWICHVRLWIRTGSAGQAGVSVCPPSRVECRIIRQYPQPSSVFAFWQAADCRYPSLWCYWTGRFPRSGQKRSLYQAADDISALRNNTPLCESYGETTDKFMDLFCKPIRRR